MLKDIDFKKVTDLAMAIIPENMEEERIWNTYLINLSDERLTAVLINSKGYGEMDGNAIKTSQMRHFFEVVQPRSYIKVEEIREELLSLSNEFWISFSKNNYLYDKKYIFVTESLRLDNLVNVPIINKEGVLII